MAIQKNPDRQWPLRAKVDFTYDNFTTEGSGVAVAAIDLPGGARVIGGQLAITTAFNSAGGTTPADNLDVGDGTTAGRYASAVDGRTVGVTALTVDQLDHDTGKGVVYITWTPNADTTTAPTAGAGFLEVEYVIEGRGNESQPV